MCRVSSGAQPTYSDGPRTVVCKRWPASESRGALVKTQVVGPILSGDLRWSAVFCISNKIPGNAGADAGPGATFHNHCPRMAFLNLRTVDIWGS